MNINLNNATLNGHIRIPGSKSHTIRALLIASMAKGQSIIRSPLFSKDTESCIEACRIMGAKIEVLPDQLVIEGTDGTIHSGGKTIDVGNSGTTLYLCASLAALGNETTRFTGDYQIQSRPISNLLTALNDLGAQVETEKNSGSAPFSIRGPLTGGKTTIECPTSQYLSSLLIGTPLALNNSEITVPLLNEQPYVEMTLSWLDEQNIHYSNSNFRNFSLVGGQSYAAFDRHVPGDFSTATFFLCGAAITGGTVKLDGLSMTDSQGDKEVVNILSAMGAELSYEDEQITITGKGLKGMEIDMNAIPDALPAMAVTACFAEGTTKLVNCPQARLKETDRIAVMAKELTKLGAKVEERPDGLIIEKSSLKGAVVKSHDDHRVAMSLAIASLLAEGETTIENADAAAVTVPKFFEYLEKLSG